MRSSLRRGILAPCADSHWEVVLRRGDGRTRRPGVPPGRRLRIHLRWPPELGACHLSWARAEPSWSCQVGTSPYPRIRPFVRRGSLSYPSRVRTWNPGWGCSLAPSIALGDSPSPGSGPRGSPVRCSEGSRFASWQRTRVSRSHVCAPTLLLAKESAAGEEAASKRLQGYAHLWWTCSSRSERLFSILKMSINSAENERAMVLAN